MATHFYHTPHVRAVHTGHDLVQMVSSHDHVLLDLTGTHYDVTGWPRAEHASIDLPIAAARAVAAALLEAIDEAVTTEPPGQPALCFGRAA